ncbi:class I SAM-dependent methyltransferase [Nocardia seriolae]|uniref:Methyltransferase n=1 Tax=Nocardia seriolae TaxID=37332 RepID=A0A0B8N0B7_9NOCA|nr:class I SAM-dependent methyltransferase [Nocardia seriolae]APA95117.1 putative methyltransferase [Nocardia seriolae]MTJ66782.1 methyltransferase domain-containing protein [Nocardia seriolae]MTJ70419.1 methyltransferase domain-containing protein [Nocardia seriolae]MTJ85382.1 methyltransferase domain-containing protein [Nocardia seriolae]MTK29378.1 methyltransferase domain-containing protein [Nocardia seriolae]
MRRGGRRPRFARRATLRRSLRLLGSFRFEQTDPAVFYGGVATDTAELVGDFYRDLTGTSLRGTIVLDVGGGPGYFADEFGRAGARYLPVEPDPSEMHAAGLRVTGAVRGSGMALPFRDDAVEICISSNVAEHVPQPWVMAEEMLRVTKPGGLMVFSYTVWLGPFGGHETGPWHYLGGEYAARRYRRKHGREPKNRFGRSLFAVRAAAGIRWARETPDDVEVLAVFPRYHPRWAWWLVRVPGLRELLVSNLVVVATKRARSAGGEATPEDAAQGGAGLGFAPR